jgi:hypothetical protein
MSQWRYLTNAVERCGGKTTGWLQGEPTLEEVFLDPIVNLMMQRNEVDPDDLRMFFDDVRRGLEGQRGRHPTWDRPHVMHPRTRFCVTPVRTPESFTRARGSSSDLRSDKPARWTRELVMLNSPLVHSARPPLNAHFKDSRGSYAETQRPALGLPSVFLDFNIGHRRQVIGNSKATRWCHVAWTSSMMVDDISDVGRFAPRVKAKAQIALSNRSQRWVLSKRITNRCRFASASSSSARSRQPAAA